MTKDYKDILYDLYDDFSAAEDAKSQQKLFEAIEKLLIDQANPDSEDYYVWGLIYYMNDKDMIDNLDLALDRFKKSVELDHNNYLARLYLAHCYHDQKDFVRALENYEEVDRHAIKDFQLWRYVKLIEQIGFCHYKSGREKTGLDYFKEVLEWYENPEIDDLAVPVEMLDCLPSDHEYIQRIKKIERYL